jgi:hypothetical protein
MAVVRNRSGIDSGEIDFSIKIDRFYDLSIRDLEAAQSTLGVLMNRCRERAEQLGEVPATY